jgi:flagellar biosynthesis/type III secretory pathway M-ring protein FliF/YscJ
MEQQAISTAVQYGVLGFVALAFAFAIIQLFKTMRADSAAAKADAKEMEKERAQWNVERATLRTEYERKHRELVESYAETMREERESCAQALREERDSNREHEDLARKEFADLMERVAVESGKASQAVVDMMQKFYDRFVGPTRSR